MYRQHVRVDLGPLDMDTEFPYGEVSVGDAERPTGNICRIISARLATAHERKIYEQNLFQA